MHAARMALETGNADHILIWIPDESENVLKNPVEKRCCMPRIRKNAHPEITDGYFSTVRCLHSAGNGSLNLDTSAKTPGEKKTIFLVERACETACFSDLTALVPVSSQAEMHRHFNELVKKKNFDLKDITAGRWYNSALAGFIALVNTIRSGPVPAVQE